VEEEDFPGAVPDLPCPAAGGGGVKLAGEEAAEEGLEDD
jgi:hypothetical protein